MKTLRVKLVGGTLEEVRTLEELETELHDIVGTDYFPIIVEDSLEIRRSSDQEVCAVITEEEEEE